MGISLGGKHQDFSEYPPSPFYDCDEHQFDFNQNVIFCVFPLIFMWLLLLSLKLSYFPDEPLEKAS